MHDDFDRRASNRVITREALATAALGVLTPFGFVKSRHRPQRARGIRTVVFVHGLGANRACFYPLQAMLRARGHTRQLAFNHRSGPSIEALGLQLKRLVDAEVKGGGVDVVAHSLGGLVTRVWLQMLGGDRRVDRCVTLGTPHRGTWAAKWLPSPMVRQLAPDSPFITHLNGLPAPRVTFHSIGAADDALILPRDSARAPFGAWTLREGIGHNALLMAPTVLQMVGDALAAPIALGAPATG